MSEDATATEPTGTDPFVTANDSFARLFLISTIFTLPEEAHARWDRLLAQGKLDKASKVLCRCADEKLRATVAELVADGTGELLTKLAVGFMTVQQGFIVSTRQQGAAEVENKVSELEMKMRRCTEVRREMPTKRKEAIDALLGEGYNRSEIYEQMRLKHESLMKGRGKHCMDEDSMWDSYKNAGGCHPKAVRPRGRPKRK